MHTRGDVWDVCCEPIVAFHIHQSARSPRVTRERHSATWRCILAPDRWVCREASELPLVAPVNAEPHNTYVSSLLRPTRQHSAQMVFLCLDLSKDPNLSSSLHPKTHLATRDCCHLCRSPPCSPCVLHIKNLVDVLDLFFIPVHPEDSQNTRPTAPCWSTIPVQVSGHFPCLDVFKVETENLKSSTAPAFSLLEAALHIANT